MSIDNENTVNSVVNDVVRIRYNQEQNEASPLLSAEHAIDEVEDNSHLKASSNTILVALAIYAFGQALILASGLDAITELICNEHFGETFDDMPLYTGNITVTGRLQGSIDTMLAEPDPRCRTAEVSGLVASFSANRVLITGLLGVVVYPRLSSFSDRFGRKPMMIWAAGCSIIAEMIALTCMIYPSSVNYRYFLLAAFFQGSGGSIASVQLLNSSYIVDCAPLKDRAKMLGRLDSVMFGCLALGPLAGSALLRQYDSLVLLYVITLIAMVIFGLMVIFGVTESRPLKERRMSQALYDEVLLSENYHESASLGEKAGMWRKSILRQINIFGPLVVIGFFHIRDKRRRRNARLLALMSAGGAEIALSVAAVILLYTEMQFKWTSVQTGYLMTIGGTLRMILLGIAYPVIIKTMHKWFGSRSHWNIDHSDLVLMQLGVAIHVVGYLLMGNAPSGILFIAALVFETGGIILMPTLKSCLVKYADHGKIGELFGGISLINSLGSTVLPIVFLKTFQNTAATMPNAIFYMGSVGFSLLLLITLVIRPQKDHLDHSDFEDDELEETQ